MDEVRELARLNVDGHFNGGTRTRLPDSDGDRGAGMAGCCPRSA
jgi:hypothetical protein